MLIGKRECFWLFWTVFILASVFLCGGCVGQTGSSSSFAPTHKNVILISIDTLRADELGGYGSTDGLTPALDYFAKNGILFQKATANAPWTLPSHATMLSGMYPFTHRALDGETGLEDDKFFLPDYLQQSGYATGGFVSVLWVDKKFGFARGMDQHMLLEDSPPRAVVDQALKWIKQQDKPFFCFIHLFTPHEPYYPPKKMWGERYTPSCPENIPKGFSRVAVLRQDPTELKCRRELYRAEIARTDKALKDFFKGFRQTKASKDTLTIVTSDHGEGFYEHGLVGHGHSLFQEILAVPLILAGPDVPGGLKSEARVGHIDLVPTILGWLKHPLPLEFDGVNILDEKALAKRKFFFSAVALKSFVGVAAYQGRYKFIYAGPNMMGPVKLTPVLYDLLLDPNETNNLIEKKHAVAERLHKKIFDRPELARRTGYVIRYRSGNLLDEVRLAVECDGKIVGCNSIDFFENKTRMSASHYLNTKVITRENSCQAVYNTGRSPETLLIVPDRPETQCSVQIVSKEMRAEELATRIFPATDREGDLPMVIFPVNHPIDPDQSPGTFHVGERPVLTLTTPLENAVTTKKVVLDESEKAKLQALGYMQ